MKSNAQGTNALVFGRVTYQMMAAWWPTPMAAQAMPEVAKGMNEAPKYVFSRALGTADWSNTTLLTGDPATEIARIKQTPGPDLTVLGSGSIVTQLAAAGLIDEVQPRMAAYSWSITAGQLKHRTLPQPHHLRSLRSGRAMEVTMLVSTTLLELCSERVDLRAQIR